MLLKALFLCSLLCHVASVRLSFGNATPQSPAMSLSAELIDMQGTLRQTITWTFQATQCEVLVRTDETILARARTVSSTSSCVNRNVCTIRGGPIPTPISCEEFNRRLG